MIALRITVDGQQNALMLIKILRSMSFVKEVETDLSVEKNENQFDSIKNLLSTIEPGSVFSEIKNPIEWQKQIRNDW